MSIEWSTWSWNPVIGCSPVSRGCAHCYAAITAYRLTRMGNKDYTGLVEPGAQHALWTGAVSEMPQRLAEPMRKKKPQVVFVNSMSDLFHPRVSFEFIAAVLGVVMACRQHQFVVLTKHIEQALEFHTWLRSDHIRMAGNMAGACLTQMRMANGVPEATREEILTRTGDEPWPPENLWLGPSLEGVNEAARRRPATSALMAAGYNTVFSCEPLLDDLSPELPFFWPSHGKARSWLIAGGESGEAARACDLEWLMKLRDFCAAKNVPFYCKQLGSWPITRATAPRGLEPRDERGADVAEWPESLRVFQAPPEIAAILNTKKNGRPVTTVGVPGSTDWEPPEQERSDA